MVSANSWRRLNSGTNASASRWAMPAVGSSNKSRRGRASTIEARSTTRLVPVDSSAIWWRRNRSIPNEPITWATASRLDRSDRRAQGIWKVDDRTPTGRRASSVNNRTSSTVSSGNRRQSWKDRTTPSADRSSGRYSTRLSPSRRTVPARGVTSPEITSSIVVFPDPLAPIRPTIEPGSATRRAPSRAWTPPKVTTTSSTSRRAGPVRPAPLRSALIRPAPRRRPVHLPGRGHGASLDHPAPDRGVRRRRWPGPRAGGAVRPGRRGDRG